MTRDSTTFPRKMRGFQRTSHLLERRIKDAGQSRGFTVTRLLTHWADIVGERHSKVTRPINVGYGREGFGATLTVLTTGAQAPMVQAELPKIIDRVNAVYGYRAISRIRLTQTAPTGFAEGQASFTPAPRPDVQPDQTSTVEARQTARGVADTRLRVALEALGANVYSKSKSKKGRPDE